MSVVFEAVNEPAFAGGGIAHVLRSWRSLRRRELVVFALAGLLFGLLDLSSLIEVDVGDRMPAVMLRHLSIPIIGSLVLLLFWLPADRSDPQHRHRNLRLALAALMGSLAAIVILNWLGKQMPWPSIMDLMRAKKGLPPYPDSSLIGVLGDTLWVLLPSALMVTVCELLRRRQRSEDTLIRVLDEHSQLRRRVMASRLATLQAQVEPELLFEALVDIEQSYGRGEREAAARMDVLIRHLRVALPRLRDSGSTLEAEAELLATYLGVLQGLSNVPLHFDQQWPAELASTAVPPMLLLPLLQRALRLSKPMRCSLNAERRWSGEGGVAICLGFDQPGLCSEDEEIKALTSRLSGLNETARLRCHSDATHTTFTIELQQ